MRPIRLELQGFGAFREHTTIDFERVDLFALVGSTGSGKSTVIDGICFALYGSVPRYDDKRTVSPIVTMGAIEARVSLTFEVDGHRFIATRVVRRDKKGATTKEARLEEVDCDVRAGSANEMTTAVQDLLGLSFEHFTRAVVLPQNEFARFLHDTPGDRQELLVSLLGFDVYARMMQRARKIADEHDVNVTRAQQRLAELEDCTPDQQEIREQWVSEYAALHGEVRGARDALAKLEREATEANEEVERQRQIVTRLKAVGVPARFEKLAAGREVSATALEQATQAGAAAMSGVTTAQAALDQLGPRDPLIGARNAYAELDDVRAKHAEAVQQAEQSEAGIAPAVEALSEAEASLESLRVAHAAHTLVGSLAVGEPCPVCDQLVSRVPRRKAPAAPTSAKKKVETARGAERRARDDAAAAKQRVAGFDERRRGLSAKVAEQPDVAEVERRLAALDAAAEAVADARTVEAAARGNEDKARRALDSVEKKLKEAETVFRDQRDALVRVRVEPPPERGDLASDWPELAAWATNELPVHAEAGTAAAARAKAMMQERDDALGALVTRAIELDVDITKRATADELGDAVVRAEEGAKAQLARVKAGIKERVGLEQEVKRLGSEGQVARELARLLDAKHFERWLAVEALELLIIGASERLRELSAGQYSLASDETSRDLLVVDHGNADERRSVRTLSGGETFQASLALALALADQLRELAADGAARLEAIFLDEGFGSLDADTLETVAGTIESLGVGDRMVGVVTHVRELADRMPVQYRVAKGPRTATVERLSR